MYILFISSVDKLDIFFSAQFNNNSNKKKCQIHGFNPTQPDPLGWVGLNPCDKLGWVGFFLTHYSGLGQKIIST